MITKLAKAAAIIVFGLTMFALKGLIGTWFLDLFIDWPITWVNVLITSVVLEIAVIGGSLTYKYKK